MSKYIISFVLSVFFLPHANAISSELTSEINRSSHPGCHESYFTGSARVANHVDACQEARYIANSAARLNCYFSGHARCEVVSSYIVSNNGSVCEVRSAAEPTNGICIENRAFYRSAWARNYGSKEENCRVAERVAYDAANYDCRSRFRRCSFKQAAIIRYDGTMCEVGVVVHGR